MAGTSQQGITINVQAQITGWEKSLKTFQDAVKNVNVGTNAGKQLNSMIDDFASRLKAFQKEPQIQVFSDRQIDSTMSKIEGVEKLIQSIVARFNSLGDKNISLGNLGPEVTNMVQSLATFKAALGDLKGMTLGELVKDAPQLIELFKTLGVSLDTNNFKGAGAAISSELKAATKEAASLQSEIAGIDKEMAKIQNAQAQKNSNKPIAILNDDVYAKQLEQITDIGTKFDEGKMRGLADQMKANIDKVISGVHVSDSVKQKGEEFKKEIEKAFSGENLTFDGLKSGIDNLLSQISNGKDKGAFAGLIKKGELLEGTGLSTSLKGKGIADSLIDQNAIEVVRMRAQELLNTFKTVFSEDEVNKLMTLFNKGDMDNLGKQFAEMFTHVKEVYNQEREKATTELTNLQGRRDNLVARLQNAEARVGVATTAQGDFQTQINNLQSSISNFESRISKIEDALNGKTSEAKGRLQQQVTPEAIASQKRMQVATTAADEYHRELNKVMSAEKALGSFQNLITRWFSVYGAVRMVRQAIKAMVADIKELDTTINKISIVTNFSMDELWAQIPKYTQMAQQYGVAISGVYEVSQLYYQQGLKTAEVTEMTTETLKLAKISGLDYSTATNYMTNAVRSFKMEMSEAGTVTDAYAALAASSASSVEELATAMSKTASSAQAVGMTMQETASMMAVMIEATREAPENIGSAMKSIISRYGEMTSDPSKLVDSEGQEMSLNKVDKALQTVGISIHDAQGQFRSFTDVINELSGKWNTLSSNTQRYIATVMAGNRQQSRFLALVSSGERLQQLTDVANNSEGTGQLQTLKTMDTIESKAQQAKTALQEIYNTQGLQNLIKNWYDFEKAIAKFYATVAKVSTGNLIGTILLQFTSLATAVASIFGVIKQAFTHHTKMAQAEMTIITELETNKRIEAAQREAAESNAAIQTEVPNEQQVQSEKSIIRQTFSMQGAQPKGISAFSWGNGKAGMIGRGAAMMGGAIMSLVGTGLTTAAAKMEEKTQDQREAKANKTMWGGGLTGAGTGMSMGAMFGPWGMAIGAALGGIVGLLNASQTAAAMRHESNTEKMQRLKEDYEEKNNKALESTNEVKSLQSLKEQYDKLYAARNLSNESMQEYRDLCNSIASQHSELISGYDSEGNAIINMGSAYDNLYKIKKKQMLLDQKAAIIARTNYNSDINVQAQQYGLHHIEDDNNAGYGWGGWSAGHAFDLGGFGRGYGYQKGLQALSEGAGKGKIVSYSINAMIGTTSERAADNNLFTIGAGNNIIYSTKDAMRLSKDMGRIYYNDENAMIMSDGDHYYTGSEDLGQKFLDLYGNLPVDTVVKLINDQIKEAGYNEAWYVTPEFVENLFNEAKMADDKTMADKARKEFGKGIADFVAMTFEDDTKHTGIEIAMYRELVTKRAQEKAKDEKVDLDKLEGEIMDNMIDDTGEWGITNVLNSPSLANMSKAKKQQMTDIWNNIAQYNEEEFEAIVEALGLDDKLEELLKEHRNEVTKESKKHFKDLIQKDLRYTSGNLDNVDRNGQVIGKEVQAISDETLEQWIGKYDKKTDSWIGGFFSPQQFENIGAQYEKVISNDNFSGITKDAITKAMTGVYEAIRTSGRTDATEIANLVAQADLSTYEGIYTLADALERYGIFLTDTEGLGAELSNLIDSVQVNVISGIHTYLNTLSDKVKKMTETLKKGMEGMDFDDAMKLATELEVEFTSDTFEFKGGKFYYKDVNKIVEKNIADIYQARDQMINELDTNSKSIVKSYNKVRDLLTGSNALVLHSTITGDLTLGDLINREQEFITDETGWVDVFHQHGLDSQKDLAEKLQQHQYLYSKFGDQTKSFYDWIDDDNAIWEAWYKSAIAGDENSINSLIALTGLDKYEATMINEELQTTWSKWSTMTGKERNQYGGVFLAFAVNQIDKLKESANFSDDVVNYLVAQTTITNDALEAWWDNNTVIQKILADGIINQAEYKENVLKALRENDWDYLKDNVSKEMYDELVKYSDLFYQNYQNLLKDSFSLMSKSITEGPQLIKITSANKELLRKWGTDTTGQKFDKIGESEVNPIENYENAILDLSAKSVDELNTFLQDTMHTGTLTGQTRIETITSIQKAIGERSLKTVMGKVVGSYESITYDIVSQLAQLVGITVKELEENWLTYNKVLGTYKITPENIRKLLLSQGLALTPELEAQLITHEASLSISSAMQDIIKNYDKVTASVLGTYAERIGISYDAMLSLFNISDNGDETYRVKLSEIKRMIDFSRGKISDEEYDNLQRQLYSLYDSIISEITNIPNSMKSGFTKTTDMQKYVDLINDSGLFSIEYQMLGKNGLFEWNERLHTYVYSTTGLMAQIQYFYRNLDGMTESQREATQQLLKENSRQLAAAIDIKGYLSSERTEEDWVAVGEAYQAYVDYTSKLNAEIMARDARIAAAAEEKKLRRRTQNGKIIEAAMGAGVKLEGSELVEKQLKLPAIEEKGQQIILPEATVRNFIDSGGKSALNIVKTIYEAAGKTLTATDAKTVYRAEITRFTDTVSKELTAMRNEIVDEETMKILQKGGYKFDEQLADRGIYLVTEVGDNLYAIYKAYFDELQKTNDATLKELNDAQANILATSRQWGNNEQSAIDILTKGTELTYNELAEFFTSMGWEFSEESMDALRKAGIVEARGGNKVAITNWKALADIAGFAYGSPEYVAGLSAYNDAIIKMNNSVEEAVDNELDAFTKARRGDQINLTYFTDQLEKVAYKKWAKEQWDLGKGDNEVELDDYWYEINLQLLHYGAYIKDGILQLTDNANLRGVIQTLKQYGTEAGILTKEQIRQLEDALTGMITNFVDLVKKGITGSLSALDYDNLEELIGEFGLSTKLNFVPTAEGLQLTTRSVVQLYNDMKSINALAAQTIFTELTNSLQNSNRELKSMSGVLNQIHTLQGQINSISKDAKGAEAEKLEILKQELEVYKQMEFQMQLANPESYKMFESGDAYSGVQGFTTFVGQFAPLSKTLQEAGKNGYMGLEDFETWARGMTNMAQAIGQDVVSCGITFDKAGTQYANLMKNANVQIKDGSNVIDINNLGIGVNFDASAALAQTEGNQDAIQKYADEQVKMLDSVIAVLEIIVAMEDLKELDVNGDTILDLDEIFTEITYNADNTIASAKGFADGVSNLGKTILVAVKEDDKLVERLTAFQVGETNLYEIISAIANGNYQNYIDLFGGDANTAAAVIQWLYSSNLFNWDNVTEGLAQWETWFTNNAHLGTLDLTYTIDGIRTFIKKDGGTASVSEKVYQSLVKQLTTDTRAKTKAEEIVKRAFTYKAEDLFNEAKQGVESSWEALAIALSQDSKTGIKQNNEGGYTITFKTKDGTTKSISWTNSASEDAIKAMAATMFLPHEKTTDIIWDEQELPYVIQSKGNLQYEVHLNEDKNGTQVIIGDNAAYQGKGSTLDEALQDAYQKYLEEPLLKEEAKDFRFSKSFQIAMEIDDKYVAEFSKENILKIDGMRQKLLEAWTKHNDDDFNIWKSQLENQYDFNMDNIENWDQLGEILGFTETDVVVNGSFSGPDKEEIKTLLQAVQNGKDLGTVSSTIQVKTETIDGQQITTLVQWYRKNEETGDFEPTNEKDESRVYAIEYTLKYTDSEGNKLEDPEILGLKKYDKEGNIILHYNYSDSGFEGAPVTSFLNNLQENPDGEGKLIPVKIEYTEDNAQKLAIYHYQLGTNEIKLGYDVNTNELQSIAAVIQGTELQITPVVDEGNGKLSSLSILSGDDTITYEINGDYSSLQQLLDDLAEFGNIKDGQLILTIGGEAPESDELISSLIALAQITAKRSQGINMPVVLSGEADLAKMLLGFDENGNKKVQKVAGVDIENRVVTTDSRGRTIVQERDILYRHIGTGDVEWASEWEKMSPKEKEQYERFSAEITYTVDENGNPLDILGYKRMDSEGNLVVSVTYDEGTDELKIEKYTKGTQKIEFSYVLKKDNLKEGEEEALNIIELLKTIDTLANGGTPSDQSLWSFLSAEDRTAIAQLSGLLALDTTKTFNINASIQPAASSLITALNNLQAAIEKGMGGGENKTTSSSQTSSQNAAAAFAAQQRANWIAENFRQGATLNEDQLRNFVSFFADKDFVGPIVEHIMRLGQGESYEIGGTEFVNYNGNIVTKAEANRRQQKQNEIDVANKQAQEAAELLAAEEERRATELRVRAEREEREEKEVEAAKAAAKEAKYQANWEAYVQEHPTLPLPEFQVNAFSKLVDIFDEYGINIAETIGTSYEAFSKLSSFTARGIKFVKDGDQWVTEAEAARRKAWKDLDIEDLQGNINKREDELIKAQLAAQEAQRKELESRELGEERYYQEGNNNTFAITKSGLLVLLDSNGRPVSYEVDKKITDKTGTSYDIERNGDTITAVGGIPLKLKIGSDDTTQISEGAAQVIAQYEEWYQGGIATQYDNNFGQYLVEPQKQTATLSKIMPNDKKKTLTELARGNSYGAVYVGLYSGTDQNTNTQMSLSAAQIKYLEDWANMEDYTSALRMDSVGYSFDNVHLDAVKPGSGHTKAGQTNVEIWTDAGDLWSHMFDFSKMTLRWGHDYEPLTSKKQPEGYKAENSHKSDVQKARFRSLLLEALVDGGVLVNTGNRYVQGSESSEDFFRRTVRNDLDNLWTVYHETALPGYEDSTLYKIYSSSWEAQKKGVQTLVNWYNAQGIENPFDYAMKTFRNADTGYIYSNSSISGINGADSFEDIMKAYLTQGMPISENTLPLITKYYHNGKEETINPELLEYMSLSFISDNADAFLAAYTPYQIEQWFTVIDKMDGTIGNMVEAGQDFHKQLIQAKTNYMQLTDRDYGRIINSEGKIQVGEDKWIDLTTFTQGEGQTTKEALETFISSFDDLETAAMALDALIPYLERNGQGAIAEEIRQELQNGQPLIYRSGQEDMKYLGVAAGIKEYTNIYTYDDIIAKAKTENSDIQSVYDQLKQHADAVYLGDNKALLAKTKDIIDLTTGLAEISKGMEDGYTYMNGMYYKKVGTVDDETSLVNAIEKAQQEGKPQQVEVKLTDGSLQITVYVKTQEGENPKGMAVGNVTISGTANTGSAKAKGDTLMGELGPELVVSNGHYFVAGQNGAEFVNLADDAIVFNHLQTENLLKHGHGGHGRPVTNEKVATSYAKGNASGPALASASSALSTLKALRDMWKNLAKSGLSEFAQQAGGGGGGGGGDKNAAFLADLDRWYNLLREIDRLEKDITYQETLRSKLEKDRVIDGKAYYESQKQSIKLLEDEIAKKHELVILQKQYYDARRKDLEASPFGEFISYDEHGHLQHTSAYYDKLADLMAQNGDSSAKYTAEEQYNMLVSWGFEDQMRYDTSGKEVELKDGEGYAAAVQAFWDKLQKWQDDIDELYDGFTDYQNDILDLEGKYNELLQKIVDNQISLENRIEKAIEDQRQREIDEAKSQKDAIQKSSQDFIQGLTDSLDKERKMYENSQSQNELNRMRRQLAILQRSGGSASQIRSLQQDIASREQDEYFKAQQDQIDAIQKASEAEIKKLEQQVSIMEETLKYEKEHGLLWDEVKNIMDQTPQEIEQFLLENSKDLESKSTLQIAEDLRTIKSEIEQWIGYRDDNNNPISSEGSHNWNSYYTAAQSAYSLDESKDQNIINAAKAAYNETYELTGDENAAARAADEIFYKQFGDRPGAHAVTENTSVGTGSSKSGSGGGGPGKKTGVQYCSYLDNKLMSTGNIIVQKPGKYPIDRNQAPSINTSQTFTYDHTDPSTGEYTVKKGSTTIVKIYYKSVSNTNSTEKKQTGWIITGETADGKSITETYHGMDKKMADAKLWFRRNHNGISFVSISAVPKYKKGGLADYTGLAMVHGSPSDPEAFLNADETHMWRDKILSGNSGSLTSMLLDFQDMVSGMVSSDNYSEIGMSGSGINIENAVVNMNATISNDYDARRAADTVMEEMVRIARKTTAQQARR